MQGLHPSPVGGPQTRRSPASCQTKAFETVTDQAPPITRLILASSSPRRASVLRQLGIDFEIVVPDIDEVRHPGEGPKRLAERLAREKAERCAQSGRLAFGFDTLVAHAGEILGKPTSAAEAVAMAERLSGDSHEVFTGIAAATPQRVESRVERTLVHFRSLGPGDAARYVETGEPLDKAGAYGIQGAGATLVSGIEGDFFNVMGFPIQRFLDLLAAFDLGYDFQGVISNQGNS